jgi:hypothetical protein
MAWTPCPDSLYATTPLPLPELDAYKPGPLLFVTPKAASAALTDPE